MKCFQGKRSKVEVEVMITTPIIADAYIRLYGVEADFFCFFFQSQVRNLYIIPMGYFAVCSGDSK